MKELSSKERMLIAMRRGQPDIVPVSPDMSNMIPCKLTGKPFWKIYYEQNPPLWKAYADAVNFFSFDGLQTHGYLNYIYVGAHRSFSNSIVSRSSDCLVVRTICNTPEGDLWMETTYPVADPPTITRGWIKDLKEDMPKIRYMLPQISGYDATPLKEMMAYSGETAAVSGSIPIPGLHDFVQMFDGGLQAVVDTEADCPDEFAELIKMRTEHYLRMAEMMIDARPDFFMMSANGLYTLQSPSQFRRYSLPVIQKMTAMSKHARLPSFLHSCGKQRELIDILAKETDLDVINPLESLPTGDCDLEEIKTTYGDRFALMGNIHTTDIMLLGSSFAVRDECRKAIDTAAAGGGFILSTGDQCGRDTPHINIKTMIDTARKYGRY